MADGSLMGSAASIRNSTTEKRFNKGKKKDAPDPIDIEVGARIRILRKRLSISQSALAEALGLTFQQVQKYEKGSNRVSASMLVKIAAKLKTTVGALVGENDSEGAPTHLLPAMAKSHVGEIVSGLDQLNSEDRKLVLQCVSRLQQGPQKQ